MLLRSSEIEKTLDGTAQGRTISKSDEAATRKSYLSGQPSCADFLHMTLDSTPVAARNDKRVRIWPQAFQGKKISIIKTI